MSDTDALNAVSKSEKWHPGAALFLPMPVVAPVEEAVAVTPVVVPPVSASVRNS